MSSETITRNDLTNVLNEVLPSGLKGISNDDNNNILINNKLYVNGGIIQINEDESRLAEEDRATGFHAERTDTGTRIYTGIGTAGYNHGVRSSSLAKWLVYANGDSNSADYGNVYCNGVRMGKITSSTISDIITVNSTNATITSASYAENAGIAMISIQFTNKNAITVSSAGQFDDITIGTLVSGKRPAIMSFGIDQSTSNRCTYSISTTGVVNIATAEATGSQRTIAAGSTLYCRAIYILA